MTHKMKTLALDIETAPNTAYVWGLFKQNISINHLIETSRVLCFSAQWVGSRKAPVFWSEHTHSREEMLAAAWNLLDEADAVLTYNGESFDIPVLNKEFLKWGLAPPMPYKSIDLCKKLRGAKKFRFSSHKLDHILKELGLDGKVKHEGFGLWVKCMEGDDKAWKKMEQYNKRDVRGLMELYEHTLPWIGGHPNVALYGDEAPVDPTCPQCGSVDLVSKGVQVNQTHKYRRFRCNDCGTPVQGRRTLVPGNTDNVLKRIQP